jgi:hypothetical protein
MRTLLLFLFLIPALTAVTQDTKEVPYQVELKRKPQGEDFEGLIPKRVGDFVRTDYKAPQPGLDGEAVYKAGKQEIFMLFSLQDNWKDLWDTMETIRTETKNEKLSEPALYKNGKNLSYIRLVGKSIAFFAWTRDKYCFSADSKNGDKGALERFINAFPY